jgi:hypothetical protein
LLIKLYNNYIINLNIKKLIKLYLFLIIKL